MTAKIIQHLIVSPIEFREFNTRAYVHECLGWRLMLSLGGMVYLTSESRGGSIRLEVKGMSRSIV